jgi:hypothetical protein
MKNIKSLYAKTVPKTVSYVILLTLVKDVTLELTYSIMSATKTVPTTTETMIMLLPLAFVVLVPKTVKNVMLSLVLNVTLLSLSLLKIPRLVFSTVKKEASNNMPLLILMRVMPVNLAVFSAKLAMMPSLAPLVSMN